MLKIFFLKFLILSLVVFCSIYWLLYYFPNGYKDPFYKRFSTPPAPSLIIGTSRAAQGIVPFVLEKELKNSNYNVPIFNYAFTILHSPFGEEYSNSIKRKIKHSESKNGLFILAVDPWSISASVYKDSLKEATSIMKDVSSVNSNPNFQYFFKFYKPLYNLLLPPTSNRIFLHDDGWLEISIDTNSQQTKREMRESLIEKIKNYEGNTKTLRKSSFRIEELNKLIEYLQTEGDVFLVRLPVCKEMINLEKKYMPSFDTIINEIANRYRINYFNYTKHPEDFITIDGNHLLNCSGVKVSKMIAHDIIQSKKNNR